MKTGMSDLLSMLCKRAAAAALLAALSLCAPQDGSARSNTGFNFLRIGAGTRQLAMGNAGVALEGDANSAAYNPATLAELDHQEAAFLHTQWLDDITYQHAAYAHPFSRLGTFAISLDHLSYGQIEGYDEFNNRTGDPSASDTALALSYGKALKSGVALGLTTRYIREDLSAAVAQAWGFDGGMTYRLPGESAWSNFIAGLAVRNLGPKAKVVQESVSLPMQFDLGTAYREPRGRYTATVEAHYLQNRPISMSLGGELAALENVFLRAGYATGEDIRTGVSAGMGLEVWDNRLRIDYAFVPFQEINSAHRIGISFKFGGLAYTHYRRGVKLMKQKRYAEAILEFNNVLKIDPAHRQASQQMRKAAAYLKEEQP